MDFFASYFVLAEIYVLLALSTNLLVGVVGIFSVSQAAAVGVGAYIAVAGLWASPVSGASMNPARSLGPAVAGGHLHDLWIYLTAPPIGMLLAVGAAYILRGPGGDPDATRAAQGTSGTG